MLKKSRTLKIMVVFIFLFITVFSNNMAIPVQAYSDVSNMTDQTFFGVWNGSSWTTVGKLDYAISGLSTVQTDVKSSNYTQAKADLLTYMRNRTTRTMPGYTVPPNDTVALKALLEADNFYFTGGDDYPLAVSTFSETPATVSSTVTDATNSALESTGQISFLLMARTHSSNAVNINSKDSGSNIPRLVVTLEGGGQQTFYPAKDTFVRPGSYGTTNFGSDSYLVVKGEGSPTTDNTRESYVTFDISSLGVSGVQDASLKLYGSANVGNMDIVVMKSGETGYNESTMTWNNTIHYTYSWQGVSGGTDWNKPPYSQSEFHISICRFDFAPDIMATYLATSNEYYASNLIRIWLDFVTDKGNGNPLSTRTLDAGIRADWMAQAYNVLRNSPSLDAAANTAMLKFFWQMADKLYLDSNFTSTSNWGQSETRGMYDIAVYFPEFTAGQGGSGWLQKAKDRFKILMSGLVYWDGSYKEPTSAYATYCADSYRIIKDIAFMNNDTLDPDYDLKLQQMGRYVMDFSRPDGTEAPFGDADPFEVASCVKDIAEDYPSRPDLLYFGTYGAQGDVPAHTSSFYPVGLSAFMKTGYAVNDMFMSIDMNSDSAGPGSGHGHPDLNSVTAYAYGRDLLVDPGRYSYTNETVSNWLRRTTVAHNTIEIDNSNQITGTAARNVGIWSTNNFFDFYEGDHTGYAGFDHYRDIFFIRGGYWIVSDYVTAPAGTHTYNQTWHMLPSANVAIDSNTKTLKTAFSSGANIQIVPADPSTITGTIQSKYYSPRMGNYSNADYGSYVKTGSGNKTFDTVLFPTQESDTNRDVRVTRLQTAPDVPTTTATALKINLDFDHIGNIGYYYLSHEANPTTPMIFGAYTFNGKAAYVETDFFGNKVLAAVKSGTELKNGDTTNLISSPTMINDLGVKWNGTTIELSGSMLVPDSSIANAVAIYAPNALSVTLNGASVPYSSSGGYIYAARAVTGFNPCSDAYVQGGTSANTNFAVTNSLVVKRNSNPNTERHAFVMFPFGGFPGMPTSAKLRLFVKGVDVDASRTIKIYGMSDTSWDENILTYNNAPAKGTYITSWTITNADGGKWFEADVSGFVSSLSPSNKYASFYLANEGASSGGNTIEFYSGDSVINKPMLVVN